MASCCTLQHQWTRWRRPIPPSTTSLPQPWKNRCSGWPFAVCPNASMQFKCYDHKIASPLAQASSDDGRNKCEIVPYSSGVSASPLTIYIVVPMNDNAKCPNKYKGDRALPEMFCMRCIIIGTGAIFPMKSKGWVGILAVLMSGNSSHGITSFR